MEFCESLSRLLRLTEYFEGVCYLFMEYPVVVLALPFVEPFLQRLCEELKVLGSSRSVVETCLPSDGVLCSSSDRLLTAPLSSPSANDFRPVKMIWPFMVLFKIVIKYVHRV